LRVGIHIPQWGLGATRAGVLEVARAAEASGLDSVWVADHIALPVTTSTRYPYSRDGTTSFKSEDGFLDALTTLAVIAGATERVRLGTSVLVVGIRHPLALAKQVATLDVLSEGRVVLGIGAGWLKEEMAALGVDYATRGARMRETVSVLRRLWTAGRAAAEGTQVQFPEMVCEPKPIQPGGPPIWVGGTSDAALRRAAEYGDGWHAVGSRPEALAEGRRRLDEFAREPGGLNFSTSAGLPADPELAGARLRDLQGIGVDDVILNLPAENVREMRAQIDRLAFEILPAIRPSAGKAAC
jgi:probable F420-dependent oxidoreductase